MGLAELIEGWNLLQSNGNIQLVAIQYSAVTEEVEAITSSIDSFPYENVLQFHRILITK